MRTYCVPVTTGGKMMKMGKLLASLQGLTIPCSLLLLASCAEMNELAKMADIKEPSVSLADTRISSLTFDSAELMLNLDVENPNPIPIRLAGFDYALNVDGKTLTHGKQDNGLDIRARDRSQIQLPVGIKFSDLMALTKGFGNKDKVPFNIDANVQVNLPVLGVRSIPVSYKNEIPIPKAPSVSVKNLSVDKVNLTNATVKLELEVDNPNSFGVDLTKLNYDLAVNGQQWAKSSASNVARINKNGKSTVSIPIRLEFATVGMTLYKTLTSSAPMDYRLQGDMNLDTTLPLLKNVNMPINKAGSVRAR
jgi:LEA14-like dessication related protein